MKTENSKAIENFKAFVARLDINASKIEALEKIIKNLIDEYRLTRGEGLSWFESSYDKEITRIFLEKLDQLDKIEDPTLLYELQKTLDSGLLPLELPDSIKEYFKEKASILYEKAINIDFIEPVESIKKRFIEASRYDSKEKIINELIERYNRSYRSSFIKETSIKTKITDIFFEHMDWFTTMIDHPDDFYLLSKTFSRHYDLPEKAREKLGNIASNLMEKAIIKGSFDAIYDYSDDYLKEPSNFEQKRKVTAGCFAALKSGRKFESSRFSFSYFVSQLEKSILDVSLESSLCKRGLFAFLEIIKIHHPILKENLFAAARLCNMIFYFFEVFCFKKEPSALRLDLDEPIVTMCNIIKIYAEQLECYPKNEIVIGIVTFMRTFMIEILKNEHGTFRKGFLKIATEAHNCIIKNEAKSLDFGGIKNAVINLYQHAFLNEKKNNKAGLVCLLKNLTKEEKFFGIGEYKNLGIWLQKNNIFQALIDAVIDAKLTAKEDIPLLMFFYKIYGYAVVSDLHQKEKLKSIIIGKLLNLSESTEEKVTSFLIAIYNDENFKALDYDLRVKILCRLELHRIEQIKNLILEYKKEKLMDGYGSIFIPELQKKINEWESENAENNYKIATLLFSCAALPGLSGEIQDKAFSLCHDAAGKGCYDAILWMAQQAKTPVVAFPWLLKLIKKNINPEIEHAFIGIAERCNDPDLLSAGSDVLNKSKETRQYALLCDVFRLKFLEDNSEHYQLVKQSIFENIAICDGAVLLKVFAHAFIASFSSENTAQQKKWLDIAEKSANKFKENNVAFDFGGIKESTIHLYQIALTCSHSVSEIMSVLKQVLKCHSKEEHKTFYAWLEKSGCLNKISDAAKNKNASLMDRFNQYLLLSRLYIDHQTKAYESVVSELFHLYAENRVLGSLGIEILSLLGQNSREKKDFLGAIEHYQAALKIDKSHKQLKNDCDQLVEEMEAYIVFLKEKEQKKDPQASLLSSLSSLGGFFSQLPLYKTLEETLSHFKKAFVVESGPSVTNSIGNDVL